MLGTFGCIGWSLDGSMRWAMCLWLCNLRFSWVANAVDPAHQSSCCCLQHRMSASGPEAEAYCAPGILTPHLPDQCMSGGRLNGCRVAIVACDGASVAAVAASHNQLFAVEMTLDPGSAARPAARDPKKEAQRVLGPPLPVAEVQCSPLRLPGPLREIVYVKHSPDHGQVAVADTCGRVCVGRVPPEGASDDDAPPAGKRPKVAPSACALAWECAVPAPAVADSGWAGRSPFRAPAVPALAQFVCSKTGLPHTPLPSPHVTRDRAGALRPFHPHAFMHDALRPVVQPQIWCMPTGHLLQRRSRSVRTDGPKGYVTPHVPTHVFGVVLG